MSTTDTASIRVIPAPSIHARTALTWLAMFPLSLLGYTIEGLVIPDWPTVVRVLILTAVVVPTVSYLAVPQLLRAHGAWHRRRSG